MQIIQIASQKRVSERILADCRLDSAPDLEEIIDLMSGECSCGPSSGRGCAYSTDTVEQNVDVAVHSVEFPVLHKSGARIEVVLNATTQRGLTTFSSMSP